MQNRLIEICQNRRFFVQSLKHDKKNATRPMAGLGRSVTCLNRHDDDGAKGNNTRLKLETARASVVQAEKTGLSQRSAYVYHGGPENDKMEATLS